MAVLKPAEICGWLATSDLIATRQLKLLSSTRLSRTCRASATKRQRTRSPKFKAAQQPNYPACTAAEAGEVCQSFHSRPRKPWIGGMRLYESSSDEEHEVQVHSAFEVGNRDSAPAPSSDTMAEQLTGEPPVQCCVAQRWPAQRWPEQRNDCPAVVESLGVGESRRRAWTPPTT